MQAEFQLGKFLFYLLFGYANLQYDTNHWLNFAEDTEVSNYRVFFHNTQITANKSTIASVILFTISTFIRLYSTIHVLYAMS